MCLSQVILSKAYEITMTLLPQQQSFMPLELPATAGEIGKSSFDFQRNLEAISAQFELLGFLQSLAFSRIALLSSASLHGSSCVLRPLQKLEDCC